MRRKTVLLVSPINQPYPTPPLHRDLFFIFNLFLCSYSMGSLEPSAAKGSCFGAEAGEGGRDGGGGEVLGVE